MKTIAIILFDDFTDIDLFLMWDILGRNTNDWIVKILGYKTHHCSTHGLSIPIKGELSEANTADVVLFCSGKKGIPAVLEDKKFLQAFSLNPKQQIIGSICAGAFVLAKLGLLDNCPATTHPDAKSALESMGIKVLDKPFVCLGNIATAGGCLAAIYLVGWLVEKLFGEAKRLETLSEILPAGQLSLFEDLISKSIEEGVIHE